MVIMMLIISRLKKKRRHLLKDETSFKQNTFDNVRRILDAGLRGDIIRTQELPLVINTVCKGFAGYLFAWDFIQENWDKLIAK